MTSMIFYDFETSGKNKDFDQILQIGGVLTDSNFQIKDKFGQRLSPPDQLNQFELVDFGHTVKPFHNGYPLQIPFLKICS